MNRQSGYAAAAVLTLIGAGLWLRHLAVADPSIVFLTRDDGAPWVAYPRMPKITARNGAELDTRFRRVFTVAATPVRAMLRFRGCRSVQVSVNDQVIPVAGGNWKELQTVDLTASLREGENTIELTVFNARGPAALSARVELDDRVIVTDETWQTSVAGSLWRAARPVSQRPDPAALSPDFPLPRTAPALRRSAGWLLACAGIVTVALVLWRRRRLTLDGRWVDAAVILAAVMWIVLFINNIPVLGLLGHDVEAHLQYIQYILDHGQLPTAQDGFSTYHPPLYHALGATMLAIGDLHSRDAATLHVLRVASLVFGVVHLIIIMAALRLIFPHKPGAQLIAVVLATFTPMHLYLFQQPTNESLVTVLITATLYLTLRMLDRDQPSWRSGVGLGLCLGAALLTKVTAMIVAVIVLAALIGRALQRRAVIQTWLVAMGATVVTCLAVCGWYWIGVWRRHGALLVSNWDPGVGPTWWQDEGYRTLGYYLRFGRSLTDPIFSLLGSFFDGYYSTFFGDSLIGGRRVYNGSLPWQTDWMLSGYVLSLLPAAAIITGAVVFTWRWIRRPGAARFVLVALPAALMLAMVYMSLRVPNYGHSRAFYTLGAILPMAAFGAWALHSLASRHRTFTWIIAIGLGTWALNSYASYWVSWSNVDVLVYRARRTGSAELLHAALASSPDHVLARLTAAEEAAKRGLFDRALEHLQSVIDADHNTSSVQSYIGLVHEAAGRSDLAESRYRQAVAMNGDDSRAHLWLARLLSQQNRRHEAIEHYRAALHERFDDATVHHELAECLEALRESARAAYHRDTAARLLAVQRGAKSTKPQNR